MTFSTWEWAEHKLTVKTFQELNIKDFTYLIQFHQLQLLKESCFRRKKIRRPVQIVHSYCNWIIRDINEEKWTVNISLLLLHTVHLRLNSTIRTDITRARYQYILKTWTYDSLTFIMKGPDPEQSENNWAISSNLSLNQKLLTSD